MKNRITTLSFIAVLLSASCSNTQSVEEKTTDIKAESIINEAIEAHGGSLYDEASYSFIFRNKLYTFTNNKNNYTYSVKGINTEEGVEKGKEVYDILKNGTLTHEVNGTKINLSQSGIEKYTGILNSVIYFASLPHKLKDKSVNKAYKGTTSIKGETYDVLEVTFDQEGGGRDHDDEFHYWINTKTKIIDYLAYNYQVNKGGVRFRSAYNQRTVDGIRFQDYVNYEAQIGTPLKELPTLYEQGELKELSRIQTENIINLNNSNNLTN